MKKHVIVIGAGSGGLTTAIGLVKVGFKVTVIEKGLIGGDCTNVGCVPSKALIWRAKKFYDFYQKLHSTNSEYAQQNTKALSKEANQALKEVREVVKEYQAEESPEWLESYGINFIKGTAMFDSPSSVKVNAGSVDFDYAVIATGSKPHAPRSIDFGNVEYLTNETVFDIKKLPKSMAIIGNGVIGCELGQALAHLGVEISIIGRSDTILPRAEKEVREAMHEEFKKLGVTYIQKETMSATKDKKGTHLTFKDQSTLTVSSVLVAAGRQANVKLDLDAADVRYTPKGIKVNKSNQTTNPRIFAVGDVAGGPMFTHFADHQGQKLVMNLAFRAKTKLPFSPFKPLESKYNPRVTYTFPEIAEVGLSEDQARETYRKIRVVTHSIEKTDRARVQSSKPGFIKIITSGPLGRIVGVSIVSDRAGDMLPEFQRLIQEQAHIWKIGSVIRAYPTYTTGINKLLLSWIGSWKSES